MKTFIFGTMGVKAVISHMESCETQISYNSMEGEYIFGIIREQVCSIVIPTSLRQSGNHQHHELGLCHIRNDNNERNRKYISSSTRVRRKRCIECFWENQIEKKRS
jgi:hypothetical protein